MQKKIFFVLLFGFKLAFSIESLDGFLITAKDDHFVVVSPENFKDKMEVIIENKTQAKLTGKILLNQKQVKAYVSVLPDKYSKSFIHLRKNDILHFVPLIPAFQEVELIVGRKKYEIPPSR